MWLMTITFIMICLNQPIKHMFNISGGGTIYIYIYVYIYIYIYFVKLKLLFQCWFSGTDYDHHEVSLYCMPYRFNSFTERIACILCMHLGVCRFFTHPTALIHLKKWILRKCIQPHFIFLAPSRMDLTENY